MIRFRKSLVASLLWVVIPVVSLAEGWSASSHELFSGDYNDDGMQDLYLKAVPATQSVTIPYDIQINVDVASSYKDVLLVNNGDGTYSLISNPPPDSVASVTWVQSTSHDLVFDDFDSDGLQDVLVQARSIGGVSVVINAPAAGEIPEIAKTIVRTQTITNENIKGRTGIDVDAGNAYSLSSNGEYVGAVEGHFTVTSSGKPNYAIPLDLVPSVRNIAPDLTLLYTGNSGNSILGVGWHLDGISKIERCATSLDQDGYINGVNFNRSDKFCLNGQRLIAVNGVYGADLTEYRTENESFARVVSYGSLGSGPQYFIVQHVTGEIEEYGNSIDSRQIAQNNPSAVTWSINKKSDREGNYVLFTYNTDKVAGHHYIDEITYTGNVATGLQPGNKIKFNYEGRIDVTPSYANGVKSVIPVRVRNIETYHSGVLVRRYELGYGAGNATSRSRLVNVSECLSDGKCLPDTVFAWDLGNEDTVFTQHNKEIDQSSYPAGVVYDNQQYHVADVNGDGRSDLIWTYRNINSLGRVLYLADKTDIGFTLTSSQTETGFTASNIPGSDQKYVTGDVNGDGREDLVWTARYLDDFYYVIYLANATGTGFVSQGYQVDSQSDYALYNDGRYQLADVNGDGRKDLVWTFIHQNKLGRAVYLAYSDSSGNVAFGKVSYDIDPDYTPEFYTHHQYATGDVNGDGKDDFLWSFVYLNKLYQVLYLANANGTGFDKISVQRDSALHAVIDDYDSSKIQLSDVNADGKMDLIWTYSVRDQLGRTLYLASDLGTSFTKKSSVLEAPEHRIPETYTSRDTRVADLNGDGRSDILFTYNKNFVFGWIAYLSDMNGEGFTERQTAEIQLPTNQTYENQHYLLGDINADGKTDLVWAYNDINTHDLERMPFTLPASHPDHVTGITDGLGNQTTIQYRYLADTGTGFYTKGSGAVYPVKDDEGLSYVVETVQESDGIGGLNRWDYAYSGARTNLHGRGFLGFKKRIITDLQTGLVTTESYRQEFPFIGLVESEVVTRANGSPVEKVYNHWKKAVVPHVGGGDGVFRYLDDAVALKYNLADGQLVLASLTDNTYDTSLGNLSQQVVATGTAFTGPIDGAFVPDGSYTLSQVSNTERNITTGFGYLNDSTANWRIGFLESKNETFTIPGQPAKTVVTSYTPYNATSFLTRSETQFAGSNVEISNTYTRDGYGNITSVVIDASDIGGTIAPRQTTFGPYDEGLYPETKTNPLGHLEQYDYNKRIGEISRITDANGLITDRIFDDFGRLVYEKSPDGSDTRTVYSFCTSSSGCLANEIYTTTTTVTHKHHNGMTGTPTVTRHHDSLGREIRSDRSGFDGPLVRTTTVYDKLGRVDKQSQPYIVGAVPQYTQFTYDELNRVREELQPDGGSTTNIYVSDPAPDGQSGHASRTISLQIVQVPDGPTKTVTTVLKRNSLEQLVEVTDAHGTLTTYAYDAQGNTRSVQVNNDAATTITIETDVAGNKTRLIDPDAGEITYEYNGVGELRRQIFDPAGIAHTITTTRDALGRIDTRIDDDGTATEVADWTWDTAANGKGLIESISGPDYNKTIEYDTFSRVSKTTTRLFNEASPKVSRFTYDGFSRPIKTAYPSGLSIRTDYNPHGYTLKHRDAGSGTVYWQANAVDAFGNVAEERYGNGLVTLRAYDPATGRLDTLKTGPSTDQIQIQNLSYQYDTAGNLNSRSSSRGLAGGETLTERFTYDHLHRVTTAVTSGLNTGSRSLSYDYDALGNITTKTGASDLDGYHYGESGAGPHAVSRVVLGGVTTNYAYDNKGNMTTAGDRTVGYTVFNKPDRITKIGMEAMFRYGPERKRFYQRHTNGSGVTETWYYDGFEVVERNDTIREKTYLGDYLVHNVVRQAGSPAAGSDLRYLHRDHIGSIESITDQNGNEIERMAFAPFGGRRQANWEEGDSTFVAGLPDITFNTTAHGFTDHEHIDTVGFIHMNGRMYDPIIGRFLSPDDFVQFPEFSQSYNRYSYVLNNPLTHTDESGEAIPLLIYGATLAWRAYSAYDTVTSGVEEAKIILDDNASTEDKVISGLSIVASVAGGKSAREAVGKLSKKAKGKNPKRESANKTRVSKPNESKGTKDENTENTLESAIQRRQNKFWTKSTTFQGNKVFQRDDLIDPAKVDPDSGMTNLELMKAGRSPIGPDGESINLHHMIQKHDGAIAEVTQSFHQQNSKVIHIKNSSTPSGINRSQFKKWRKEYWQSRANNF